MPSLPQSRSRRPNPLTTNGATGLRAAVYHRVSSEEQVDGYGLDAQSRATRQYCEAHGWTITREYRDEGKSARTDALDKRPAFAEMLADAEAGLFGAIIVHKLDRFARNLRVTLETLDRLERAKVGFVSISEQMDFTSPIGKVILATLGAFAQYYSDNLSWETRKGKHERKAQGLYNGLLPFGVKKNSDDALVAEPKTYPGLLLAFQLAADGKTDKAIADALNEAGYRTTGNRGANLFSKDTVRRILMNRFYLGELPDGDGGWLPGKHAPILDDELYDAAMRTRAQNRTAVAKVRQTAQRYSLTGLAICGNCGGPMHLHTDRHGKQRIFCYRRRQTKAVGCDQPSQFLAPIDDQLAAYLGTFALPEADYQAVIALYQRAADERDDTERRRRDLQGRLERLGERYDWGDLTRDAYQSERNRIQTELATLKQQDSRADLLGAVAAYLRDLPGAWTNANAEQRNALARAIFQQVKITGDRVAAVLPQPDFAPFLAAFTHPTNENTPNHDGSGCQSVERCRSSGSDGYCTRVVEMFRAPQVDTWAPLPCPRRHTTYAANRAERPTTDRVRPAVEPIQSEGPPRYGVPRTAIPPEEWPAVADDARRLGLRGAGKVWAVSHETIAKIKRAVIARSIGSATAG